MKRWTMRQVGEIALQELSEEEQRHFGNPPRGTIKKYRESSYKSNRVLAYLTGCQCIDSLQEDTNRIMDLRKEVEGVNRESPLSPQELKAQETERSRYYLRQCKNAMARSRRSRSCHKGLWRYLLICYCDEHDHPSTPFGPAVPDPAKMLEGLEERVEKVERGYQKDNERPRVPRCTCIPKGGGYIRNQLCPLHRRIG